MKTKKQIKDKIEEWKKEDNLHSQDKFRRLGFIEALKWVLGDYD